MKTKVYWLVLLASAAVVSQTQAHGFGGGGASFGGAHFSGGHAAPAPVHHAAPARSFAPNHASAARSQRSIANVNHAHNLAGTRLDHVYARQSANWHHDWNRGRDHWWNGHRCRFINGSWVIFDVGFDPWWQCPGYYYGYPCDDGDYGY